MDCKNGFSFKVKPILQLNLLSDIEKFGGFCEIIFYKFSNQTKGIIYIQNWEFNEEFEENLKKTYPFIENALEASFIKSKNSNTMAVLLTFNLKEQPYNIYISPDNHQIPLYTIIKADPLFFHNCLKYGHKNKMQMKRNLSKLRRR